jgi:hypothetical protein
MDINKWMLAGRGDVLPDEVLDRLDPPEEASTPHERVPAGQRNILVWATKGSPQEAPGTIGSAAATAVAAAL